MKAGKICITPVTSKKVLLGISYVGAGNRRINSGETWAK